MYRCVELEHISIVRRNRQCISNASLRTGSVFEAIASFIESQVGEVGDESALKMVLLENVVDLAAAPRIKGAQAKPKPKPKRKPKQKQKSKPKTKPKPPPRPKPQPKPPRPMRKLTGKAAKAARERLRAKRILRAQKVRERKAARRERALAKRDKAAAKRALATEMRQQAAADLEQQKPLSNLDVAAAALEARKWHLCAFRLCPTMFGIPHSRERLYMPVLHIARMKQMGLDPSVVEEMLLNLLCRFVGSQAQALSSFLLNEQSAAVQAEYDRLLRQPRDRDGQLQQRRAGSKWLESAMRRGSGWWENYRPDVQTMDIFQACTHSKKEIGKH